MSISWPSGTTAAAAAAAAALAATYGTSNTVVIKETSRSHHMACFEEFQAVEELNDMKYQAAGDGIIEHQRSPVVLQPRDYHDDEGQGQGRLQETCTFHRQGQ